MVLLFDGLKCNRMVKLYNENSADPSHQDHDASTCYGQHHCTEGVVSVDAGDASVEAVGAAGGTPSAAI